MSVETTKKKLEEQQRKACEDKLATCREILRHLTSIANRYGCIELSLVSTVISVVHTQRQIIELSRFLGVPSEITEPEEESLRPYMPALPSGKKVEMDQKKLTDLLAAEDYCRLYVAHLTRLKEFGPVRPEVEEQISACLRTLAGVQAQLYTTAT